MKLAVQTTSSEHAIDATTASSLILLPSFKAQYETEYFKTMTRLQVLNNRHHAGQPHKTATVYDLLENIAQYYERQLPQSPAAQTIFQATWS